MAHYRQLIEDEQVAAEYWAAVGERAAEIEGDFSAEDRARIIGDADLMEALYELVEAHFSRYTELGRLAGEARDVSPYGWDDRRWAHQDQAILRELDSYSSLPFDVQRAYDAALKAVEREAIRLAEIEIEDSE